MTPTRANGLSFPSCLNVTAHRNAGFLLQTTRTQHPDANERMEIAKSTETVEEGKGRKN